MDGRTFYLWRLKFTFVHYIFPLIPKKKVEVQTANIFVRGLPSVISYSSKLSSQSSSPMVSFETPAKRRSGGWIIFFSAYLRCVVLVVTESRSSKKKSRWYGVVVIAAVETKEEQHVVVALLLLLVHLLYASSFLGSSCTKNRNAVSTHRVSSLILRSILGPKSHRRGDFQHTPSSGKKPDACSSTSFIPPLPI